MRGLAGKTPFMRDACFRFMWREVSLYQTHLENAIIEWMYHICMSLLVIEYLAFIFRGLYCKNNRSFYSLNSYEESVRKEFFFWSFVCPCYVIHYDIIDWCYHIFQMNSSDHQNEHYRSKRIQINVTNNDIHVDKEEQTWISASIEATSHRLLWPLRINRETN